MHSGAGLKDMLTEGEQAQGKRDGTGNQGKSGGIETNFRE